MVIVMGRWQRWMWLLSAMVGVTLSAAGSGELVRQFGLFNLPALERAVAHEKTAAPATAADNEKRIGEIHQLCPDPAELTRQLSSNDAAAAVTAARVLQLRREILLSSPALNFDEILLIRRAAKQMGLPANFHGNASLAKTGYDNDIVRLNLRDAAAIPESVLVPPANRFVGDLCLNWQGDHLLLSMPSDKGPWQVFEVGVDGKGLRQVTPEMESDSDQSDACYLPNGDILFSSTAAMVSVPCVNGHASVANFFRCHPDGSGLRQLCFDQEHNWSPAVMANGQILYQRWEYTDTPHSSTRLLMTMNPDGTNQRGFYGSNSYWPTAFFYARPIPGHPTRVVGIAGGHHGPARVGEMVIVDPATGSGEASGIVQQIPGFGQSYKAEIRDPYANKVQTRFLHPHPIDDIRFLVACQPTPQSLWGIYLVDIFDNMLLLREEPGRAMLEPVALRSRPVPPVLPDLVNPAVKDATVAVSNIYEGPGLDGIPAGTVKSLRLFTYTFSYRNVGGLYGVIGMDGPWDMKRILGTVPVEADGSAFFKVPANTPFGMQPLDAEGKAVALMRSWTTAMPGEQMSCVGCHENSRQTPPSRPATAFLRAASEVAPWQGPERGFSFAREVQPVLDRNCTGCHDGSNALAMDLRGGDMIKDYSTQVAGNGGKNAGKFSVAYANLYPFVRGPGIESDYHLLTPMEFHADATELVQLLRKGHYNVKLSPPELERIYAWIDMNRPFHGEWSSILGNETACKLEDRRADTRRKYADIDTNHEQITPPESLPATTTPTTMRAIRPSNDTPVATAPPKAAGNADAAARTLVLGDGLAIHLRKIPAGSFTMGSSDGNPDEAPHQETITSPFWLGTYEITNAQYALFDPSHDSKVAIRSNYQFGRRDLSMSEPDQPVIRVSFEDAQAYCRWLSARIGSEVSLPSEAQWEWACRAGSVTPFSFGPADADFSTFANFSDRQVSGFAANTSAGGYTAVTAIMSPSRYDDYIPKDARFDDGAMITAPVGSYKANLWGLHDMHGNAAEWTTGTYFADAPDRVVRGGSFYDRPSRSTSSFRLPYKPWHRVFNVGFRIMLPAAITEAHAAMPQRTIIVADSGLRKLMRITAAGTVEWQYPDVYCYDLQQLENGNLLFCDSSAKKSTVRELSPTGETVWQHSIEGELFSCQRLADGNTLLGACTAGRLLEIAPDHSTVREINLKFSKGGHGISRLARKTDRNTYLVAHYGDACVREYNADGTVIRTVDAHANVFGVQDLPAGHILYSCEKGVFEVDADNRVCWQLTDSDLPAAGLKFPTGIRRLANGNTQICNWLGHGKEKQGFPVIEVTKDKQMVWQYTDTTTTRWVAAAVVVTP